jgi:hypothetical protein
MRHHGSARWLTGFALLVWLAAGCGDDPLPTKTTADTVTDAPDAFDGIAFDQWVDGSEVATDGVVADGTVDADLPDTPAEVDGTDAVDAIDVATDVAPDLGPDVPLLSFEVVSTTPTQDQTGVGAPVTFTVNFNADVRPETVTKYTVLVTALSDAVVSGKLTVTGKQLQFVATDTVPAATRVQVVITGMVQAQKGPSLQAPYTFHFYTAGLPKLEAYRRVAARYAPVLRQRIDASAAIGKSDRLRSVDYDGNWNADDNADSVEPIPPIARVGWSVAETQSHYFITYLYFWPKRVNADGTTAFANDTAGSIVLVAKFPQEHPVAVTTWFKAKSDEAMWSWATTESGFGGSSPSAVYLRGTYPEAQLFPVANDTFGCEGIPGCTPRRYPALLTNRTHQSCLLLDAGDNGAISRCPNDAATQASDKWISYLPVPLASAATQTAANPGPHATYELQSLHDEWFPRRENMGAGMLFGDTGFAYAPPSGRPGLPAHTIGSKLRTSNASDYGRPPWAWKWNVGPYYEMPQGAPALDPAWAWYARMGSKLPAFDATSKVGYSLAYCLNPLLLIDARQNGACPPGPP